MLGFHFACRNADRRSCLTWSRISSYLQKPSQATAYQSRATSGRAAWSSSSWSPDITPSRLLLFRSSSSLFKIKSRSLRYRRPKYPPDMNLALRDLISRLLKKNPSSRIQIRDIKTHDWFTSNGVLSSRSVEQCGARRGSIVVLK